MTTPNTKYKKEEKKVPNLRFPGFKGEWANKKFGELGYFLGGGTPSTKNQEFWNGYIPWISSSDLSEDNIYGINYNRYISQEAVKQSATKIVPAKSILIVSRVGVGKVAVNELELCTSQDYSNLVLADDYYLFVAYLIKIKTKRLLEFNQGTSIKGLLKSDLESLKIQIPSLPEQQKIASFLSAVDQKIQQLTRKKKLLKQYKKGVMQKIFSQEIRFRPALTEASGDENGNDFPDWEEKRLGEFASVTMGQSPDSKSYNHNANGILLIQGNADIVNRLTNPRQWTCEPTKTCEVGDLILTVRAPVGSISKSIHNACIGRGVCSIKSKNNSDIEFLYQILLDYEPKWVRLEQGSTFTAVSRTDIKSIKINLPILPEQQKIASFLTSIDKKIEIVQNKLTQSQKFKKGLLQQMFV